MSASVSNPHLPSTPRDAGPTGSSWSDVVGITASLACVVHCLAAPFLLLLLPSAGSIWAHPAAHWLLAALVLPLALWVIFRGYRVHGRRLALVAAGLGAALIVAGLVIPELGGLETQASASTSVLGATQGPGAAGGVPHAAASEGACTSACCPSLVVDAETGATGFHLPAGSLVTLLGSLFLVAAHGINLHGCRCFGRASKSDGCGCTPG